MRVWEFGSQLQNNFAFVVLPSAKREETGRTDGRLGTIKNAHLYYMFVVAFPARHLIEKEIKLK